MFSPAFMGWFHEEELNQVVKKILNGETDFTVHDDWSQTDLDYIKRKLREAGIEAELTLN